MNGNCNAGETKITKRGYFGKMRVWLNENGIANLISIPKLEADGYTVWTDTKGEWIVSTPQGKIIPFKRDKGMCVGMPYIDLQDYKQGLVLIKTVRKNMGGFTCEEIEGAKLSRKTQARVGNPPDAVFKQLIGTKELKNNPSSLDDVANRLVIFGSNVNRLKGAATRKRPHRVVRGYVKSLETFTN